MARQPIRTLLIDDEPFSRDELRHLLSSYSDIDVEGEAQSAQEALEKIIELEPDVIFLDIEMGDKNGIELASTVQKLKKVPLIVFATAYPDYAVKAFRVQAMDYVLKPFDEEQIHETVIRLREVLVNEPSPSLGGTNEEFGKLAVQQDETIYYLTPREIDYIYREGGVTKVSSQQCEYVIRYPLREIEDKLQDYSFFRTHKGFIVNLNHVEEMRPWFNGAYQLKLNNVNELIPVSRNYVKQLRARLEL
jgi:two-component system, LytTR family, response regulator LytT